MKSINLVYYNNSVGLAKDAHILKKILSREYEINDCDAFEEAVPKADVNIIIQNLDPHISEFLPRARTNILIPNLEWLSQYCLDNINRFDYVFAKSKECKDILDKYHKNVICTGFTSIDRFDPNISKKSKFLHFSGKSIQKNTELVIDVFSESGIPITIVDSTNRFKKRMPKNIDFIKRFMSEEEVNRIFNSHNVHICCSLSEGWGHYIYEALSCKAVVVTSDCSPMNDLIKDVAVIVESTNQPTDCITFSEDSQFPIRKITYTNRSDFINVIQRLNKMSKEKLENIGEMSRKAYLKINQLWEEKASSLSSTHLR